MRVIGCLLCLSSTWAFGLGNPHDSLTHLLREAITSKNFGNIALYQSHLGWHHYSAGEYDSAIMHYRQALAHENQLGNDNSASLLASSLTTLGVIFSSRGYADSSIHYYTRALTRYIALQDTASIVLIQSNLSIIYKNLGLYDKALEYSFDALSQLESQPPGRALASCYNTIGSVYFNTGDFAQALSYYSRALDIRRSISYSKGEGQSYNNLGEVYVRMQRYDSALSHFLKSLAIKQRISDYPAVTLNNIGEVYVALGQVASALPYFKESLQLARSSQDRMTQLMTLTNLADVALRQRRFVQANGYLEEGIELSEATGALEYARRLLELRIAYYEQTGDFRSATFQAQQLLKVKDKLLNKEKAESLSRMQVAYETEKKEQQISLLSKETALHEAQLEVNRYWIGSLVIVVTLTLVILILVFHQYRTSQKNKSRVEILLKELHHRVKNNLQILSSVLTLQTEHLTDMRAIEALRSSEGRVNAMALIHKELYNEGKERTIDVRFYVEELATYLARTYGFSESNLQLEIKMPAIELDVDKAIPLGLIANELITNAFKYAYCENDAPYLFIQGEVNDGTFTLLIKDNGAGIKGDWSETRGSFGLKMVKTLLKELKGQLTLTTENGTAIQIQIPLSP